MSADFSDERTVTNIAHAMLQTRPLAKALEPPIRIAPPRESSLERVIQELASRLELAAFHFCPSPNVEGWTIFEECISDRLHAQLATFVGNEQEAKHEYGDVQHLLAGRYCPSWQHRTVNCGRDANVEAYAAGSESAPAIVIAGPCGIPVGLCEKWMLALAKDYFAVTWESRGLFGSGLCAEVPSPYLAAQSDDLCAVMNSFGIERAHLMGVCGGAVTALMTAARFPARVMSLSLWHGDYSCSNEWPKTQHQRELQMLLTLAGQDRRTAAEMRDVFCGSVRRARRAGVNGLRWDLAHFLLYPFASPELLFRYARLNSSSTDAELNDLLVRVSQPTLVVTSNADGTTHPAASRALAAILPRASFYERSDGDHLSVFDASIELKRVLQQFISAS